MKSRLTQLARDEQGFSLITVMLLLFVISSFAAAAWGASNGDVQVSARDQHRQSAYDAAEAGVNYYLFHLNQDTSYWAKCDTVPGPGGGEPNPVVQQWTGTGTDTRTGHWRTLPNGGGQYAIELLPATGYTQCDPNNQVSMFDQSTGTFSIRSTGLVGGQKRSIVATFRQRGFLDFLYFTDYETIDPVANPGGPSNCAVYRRDGRSGGCPDIVFLDRDQISGPFHTNDSIVVCGSPTFGRTPANGGPDAAEVSGPAPGYQASGGCAATPSFSKPLQTGVGTIGMPPTNASLASVAGATFSGQTFITLSNTQMSVNGGALQNLPANGVIYVNTGAGGCATSYDGTPQYNDSAGCPNVYVQGTYSKSLTIATSGDVIVTGNIIRNGNYVLGLIPQNFARVYHPVSGNCGSNLSAGSTNANLGANGSSVKTPGQNMEIDAAILSLQHSFIVDNWACGSALGTLTVKGAIAQRFRGPVGTFSGNTVQTGYIKGYSYDDRLKYTSPPFFLDPIQSAWRVSRQTEQLPAR